MTAKKMTLTAIVLLLAVTGVVRAMILVGGADPIQDHGWPFGSVQLANLPARISYWAGPPFGTGSMYEFEYHGEKTGQFNEALKTFAQIRARRLELIVHNGPKINYRKSNEPAKEADRIDWTFTIWNPDDWDKLYNSPTSHRSHADHPNFKKPVAPPRMDVYIGGGSVVWDQVKVPKRVTVIDKRPGSISPKFAGKGLIRATVYDLATKKPIQGAEIVLKRRTAMSGGGQYEREKDGKTDKRGYCQIAQIPTGYYQISIVKEGHVGRSQGYWNNDLPEFHEFRIALARPHCVRGIVTDVRGQGLSGVEVSATEVLGPDGFGYGCVGGTSAVSDSEGRFEICGLPEGLMSVRCKPRSLHLKKSIFDQYKIPSDDIKLVMEGTGTVIGKVIDRRGKRPKGGILLELTPKGGNKPGTWGYSGRLKVNEEGTFEIKGIPPGEYVITTRPNPGPMDFEPNAEPVTIKAGKTYDVEILHEDLRNRATTRIRKFLERRFKNEQ